MPFRTSLCVAAAVTASLALLAVGCSDSTGPSAAAIPIVYADHVAGGNGPFHADLHLVAPDGGRDRQLTNFDGTVDSPAWSSVGHRLAFQRHRFLSAGPDDGIWTMLEDGSHLERLGSAFDGGFSPAWSPDGLAIAFFRGGSLWTAKVDGANLRMLANDVVLPLGDVFAGRSQSWSPDGALLLFTRRASPEGYQLWTVNAHDGSAARVPVAGCATGGAWSPDGARIAFVSCAAGDSGSIVLANADGSDRSRLTTATGDADPVWSPDGRQLAFSREFVPNGAVLRSKHVFVVTTADRAPLDLTPNALAALAPAWRPVR